MKRLPNKKGFTLVELMIVIVIISVLAAVAVPIYQNNVKKARMAEADATLGTIRTQLRIYQAENLTYPVAATATDVADLDIQITAAELTGTNFSASDYTYIGTATTYTITCAAGTILDSDREMDQDGVLSGGM